MFANYVASALKALKRDRFHALLNIAGLAVSLAATLLIGLYVRHELSYESFVTQPEQVYRLQTRLEVSGAEPLDLTTSPLPSLDPLILDFDGQMTVASFVSEEFSVKAGDILTTQEVSFVNEDFLKVLDFRVLHGDAAALVEPGRIVVTRSMAEKFFGREDAVGERLVIDRNNDLEIGAVIQDMPRNSDFAFEILSRKDAPFRRIAGWMKGNWTAVVLQTFVRLADGVTPASVEAQLPEFVVRHMPPQMASFSQVRFTLMPLQDIHLAGGLDALPNNRNQVFMAALGGTALLLVFIAAFNYINLTTARSLLRVKEVGLRKILGSTTRQLTLQFLSEAMATTLAAFAAAYAIAAVLLPVFAGLVDRDLSLSGLIAPDFLAVAAALLLLVGLLAGLYPALYLAQAQPTALFQNTKASTGRRSLMRGGMVLIQFSLTVGLVIAAGVVYSQVRYLKTMDIGFEKTGLLTIQGPSDPEEAARISAFREQLVLSPYFAATALANSAPDPAYGVGNLLMRQGADPGTALRLQFNFVSDGFMSVLGLPFVAGRDLPDSSPPAVKNNGTDRRAPADIVLSELAVTQLGFPSPDAAIGQAIQSGRPDSDAVFTVVGVVPDFKFKLGHAEVMPMAFAAGPGQMPVILARQQAGSQQAALEDAQRIWEGVFPDVSFEYSFLDDFMTAVNSGADRQSQLFAFFTGLAIFVACLGLFGLASFVAARRTQEIAIRKVLGASTANVTRMLLWDFAKPVLLANLVAWPLAFILMRGWLDSFAYRIELSPAFFIGGSALALVVALVTVMARTMRAARIRPAMALKYE